MQRYHTGFRRLSFGQLPGLIIHKMTNKRSFIYYALILSHNFNSFNVAGI